MEKISDNFNTLEKFIEKEDGRLEYFGRYKNDTIDSIALKHLLTKHFDNIQKGVSVSKEDLEIIKTYFDNTIKDLSRQIHRYDIDSKPRYILEEDYEYTFDGQLLVVEKGTEYYFDGLVYSPLDREKLDIYLKGDKNYPLPRTLSVEFVETKLSKSDCVFNAYVSGNENNCDE